MKRTLLLGSMLAGALALAPTAVAAPHIGGCQLSGVASFAPPGLTTTAGPFSYSFSGTLSGCNDVSGDGPGGPAGGTVSAGTTITVGGVTYQEPAATGNGSCLSSTTSGTSFVQWDDGTLTIIEYTTSGALAGVALQGTVVPSAQVTDPAGNPATLTTNSTRTAAGDGAAGALVFHPDDPTGCETGLLSANIDGVIGTGNDA